MNFYDYMIKSYVNANNPEGDLARDMQADGNFPKCSSFTRILKYLEEQGAIDACIDTFEECWNEYKGKQKK